MLSVIQFLEIHRIPFTTDGGNVSAGNVNISCPFCGADDPSYHMGISLDWSAWGCWRNSGHRGRSPYRLVSKLLGITSLEARKILGVGKSYLTDDSDFIGKLSLLNTVKSSSVIKPSLTLPDEFHPISKEMPKRFKDYLESRGYYGATYYRFFRELEVCYAVVGKWANRLIFPIYYEGLRTWTGRTIYPSTSGRGPYLTLSNTESSRSIKDLVWPYDYVNRPGNILFIVEGVFDALRINYLLPEKRIRAVCVFGKVPTSCKCAILNKLQLNYGHVVQMLDEDTWSAIDDMNFVNSLGFVPEVYKLKSRRQNMDPGEFSKKQLVEVVRRIVN